MRAWTRLTLGIILTASLAGSALAYTVDEDIAFASGLIAYKPSFRDFAQTIVDSVREREPSAADRLKVIQAELFVKDRKYEEAEKLVQEMGISNPKAQAIMLSLAIGYYNAGKTDQSIKLFDDFFAQYQDGKVPTDPDVLRFYQNAANMYAQIREGMEDFAKAADCYERVANSTDDTDLKREMQFRQAQAWAKAAEFSDGEARAEALKKCKKICNDITWGGLDITFVNAVVVLANAQIIEGDSAGARSTLDEYWDSIKQVDDMLEDYNMAKDESPLGGARSLRGKLYRQEADAVADNVQQALPLYSKALTEYYNVFVKYPKGPYGANAGLEAKAIKDILETKYGKKVEIDLPDNLQAQAAGTEFSMADSLFKKGDYEKARDEYLRVLAQFPEAGDLSVRALAQLNKSYAYLNDPLMVKVVSDYIGERFGRRFSVAPRALVAIAELYRKGDTGISPDAAFAEQLYNVYLANCPEDEQAGAILWFLGGTATTAGETDKANTYFNRIIAEHQNTKEYPLALSRQAWGAYANHDYAAAIEGLRLYLKDTDGQATPLRANAMFALADCLRRTSADAEHEAGVADKAAAAAKVQATELLKASKEAAASDPEASAAHRSAAVEAANTFKEKTAAAAAARTTADTNFKEAVRQFQALVAGLDQHLEDYGRKAEEQAKNKTLLEQARFWLAFTLSQKNDPRYQGLAVKQLTDFTNLYPSSALNPRALKLKGSLQLALKDPAANETFETLANKYPKTDEGKNAQYARISGALDLNLIDQAREAANAMISSPSSYSLEQFARVGELLLEKEVWTEAAKAYGIVRDRLSELPAEKRRSVEQRALFGIGLGLYETGDFEASQKALAELMEKYSKTALFYKANYVLAQAAFARGDTEAATASLNNILRYATDNEIINDASILMAQNQIKQDDLVGALSTYKRLELLNSYNMQGDRQRIQIHDALLQAVELEEKMPDDTSLIETVNRFLEIFPTDPRASELTGKLRRAEQRLREAANGGAADTAAAPAE